jgi:hypothetical protein
MGSSAGGDWPLTEHEHTLILAASTQVWTGELRAALAMAVEYRGFKVSPYDSPGDLADLLEQVGRR